ncbi:MAG: NUDIX hydrolase [Chloroflexaceae bacterium]|nr:NUDIX hydrolase [Chloroflexaceae bacterium]
MYRWWRYVKTLLKVIFRHPLPGAVIIPILPDGQIVLVRRRDTGQWSLPGGLVDWGETVATAARRELREETGLELIKLRRLVGVYSNMERDPRIHSIAILVEAEVQGALAVEDAAEISEARAFSLEAVPGNLAHDHDRLLSDYFQGSTVLA